MKEKILVSACLAGEKCRFDGKSKPVEKIVELVKQGKAIPFCPEVEGGLKTPRLPSEIKDNRVIRKDGIDVTENYLMGAKKALKLCQKEGIKKAVLKSKSPSCGCDKIYDGSFNKKLIKGDGITTKLLKEHEIKVMDEREFEQ